MNENKDIKEMVKKQFSLNAEKYVTSTTHAKGDDLDLLVEWLEPKSHWTVLDVATGGGHVAKKLALHTAHVFATDLTRGMLSSANQHVKLHCENVWFVVADAENLPFLDCTFDAVTCRIAAHHFPDPSQFVAEAARVLKPGGRFLLIDNVVPANEPVDEFVNRLEKLRDESHARCYRVEEWERWIKEAGFLERKVRLRKKVFDFPTWVRRTTKSENQVEEVERYIMEADTRLQEYCGLVLKDGKIIAIHIDEWMVMLEKS